MTLWALRGRSRINDNNDWSEWMIGRDFPTRPAPLSVVMACDTITSRRWALPSHPAMEVPSCRG